MKNQLQLLVPFMLLISCEWDTTVILDRERAQDQITLSWQRYLYEEREIIPLSQFKTFGECFDDISLQYKNSFFPQIALQTEKGVIIPLYVQSFEISKGACICFKKRNIWELQQVTDYSKKQFNAFYINPQQNKRYAESPRKAAIYLGLPKSTSTEEFSRLLENIFGEYQKLWNKQALMMFDKKVEELNEEEFERVYELLPMYIDFDNRLFDETKFLY
ncbi:hypothetical protein [Algivirga pacifica]|uniref:Lipoprotein n=1 Tax=Algivirga pacifica TaxID=1162670 RepID=A0ABP9DFL1_9BACT